MKEAAPRRTDLQIEPREGVLQHPRQRARSWPHATAAMDTTIGYLERNGRLTDDMVRRTSINDFSDAWNAIDENALKTSLQRDG